MRKLYLAVIVVLVIAAVEARASTDRDDAARFLPWILLVALVIWLIWYGDRRRRRGAIPTRAMPLAAEAPATTEIDLMRGMTDTQRILFQTEMLKHRKSVGVAAVLCILGPIGTHRFYLGQIGQGLVLLALSLTGAGLIITIPFAIGDLFGIRRLVERVSLEKAKIVAAQIRTLDRPVRVFEG